MDDDTLLLSLPLPFYAVKDLFGRLTTDTELPKAAIAARKAMVARIGRMNDDDDNNNNNNDDNDDDYACSTKATISKSCLGGYKSSLKSHYETDRGCKFEAPDLPLNEVTLDRWCDNFIKAYGNILAQKKQSGVMKIKEGKSEIAFDGYERFVI